MRTAISEMNITKISPVTKETPMALKFSEAEQRLTLATVVFGVNDFPTFTHRCYSRRNEPNCFSILPTRQF